MKAARMVGYKSLDFIDLPIPQPDDGEVLIKMERLSICGSDLRIYDRAHPEENYPLGIGAPCHECLGEVVESKTDKLSVGDRVIVLPSKTGGLIEYVSESPDRCIKVPNIGDPSQWIMAQPVGTVIYALQQADSVLGKRVAVLSQGAIGLAFAQLMAQAGARQVIVTDILDNRLDVARKIGATHTINAAKEDVLSAITDITNGEMIDIAVEACGRPETCNQVFQILKMQGQAILFGMTHVDDVFPFDYNAMYMRIPRIIVTNSARAGENIRAIGECVDIMSQGRLDLSHLVTHKLDFKEVQTAYEIYSEKSDNSIKVVMEV